ncbi:MAG: LEA type 2 family protein [gamma proteobacterium symbiont of Lucinoma myriamae]|nr:LEA type 2 family protein [gamma proteobacterium symbiont of Lucinoma myriamae]MCU7832562.1 LEA type 2 family protein [gamma proteobacterium symbiont of Lucinoma myriamae]
MFFKKTAYIFLILFLLLVVSGCSTIMNKPEQFKINISTIEMLESSLMEQRFQVKLRIMNRSREAVSIDGMSFDIELNDKDFASGVSNEKIMIEAFSEGLVSVRSTIFSILRQINNFKDKKSQPFKYKISGYVYSGSSLFGIPFNEKGEIDLNTRANNKGTL